MTSDMPSPELRELFWSHWKTAALRAALELRLFQGIAGGLTGAEALATARGASVKGVSRLLDALCGLGLLAKEGSVYRLTALSDPYLLVDDPRYFGARIDALASPLLWEAWGHLPEAVTTGRPVSGKDASDADFSHWRKLSRALVPSARLGGEALWDLVNSPATSASGQRILDLGCGSGVYSFCLLQRDSSARATLADWPQVLETAAEVASEMGVASQVDYLPGDILASDLDENAYDLALVSNVLHGMGPEDCRALLRRAHSALKAGGTVVINEYLADEDRSSETFALLFSLHMLLISPEGDAYALSEIMEWMAESGFEDGAYRGQAGLGNVITGQNR